MTTSAEMRVVVMGKPHVFSTRVTPGWACVGPSGWLWVRIKPTISNHTRLDGSTLG